MARQWQIRRGTTLQNDEFTGAIGEVTMDTTNNTVRIHDGTTVGGIKIGDVANATKNQNASSLNTSIYDWVGTLEQYTTQNIATTHPEWVCYITDDSSTMLKPIRQEVSERNIGELVYTTVPVIDAGLHLADGTVLNGTGIYTDFYNYMLDVYNNGHVSIFCSEADWQTANTNYGKCGKYVLDTTNQTIRLPKISGFIEGTISEAEIGARTAAGLPDITGHVAKWNTYLDSWSVTGAFYEDGHSSGSRYLQHSSDSPDQTQVSFAASKSNSIYGASNTVQPESIKLYTYIVIANTDKTPVQVDIDNIADDLEHKADLNLANSSVITNCVTKIPQDIKLELNNGVLTLKAGSKVYIPNGFEQDGVTKKFDVINIETDQTYSGISNDTVMISYTPNNSGWDSTIGSAYDTISSATEPTGTPLLLWYDTTNNIIKRWDTEWFDKWSLPLCSISNNKISQVFNGFGYIGSVVYSLPGVKALIPNGRNKDRTLNNFVLNIQSIQMRDFSEGDTDAHVLLFPNTTGSLNRYGEKNIYYDKENNYIHNATNNEIIYNCVCGSFDIVSDKVQNLDIYTPFRAVDYNEFNEHRVIAFQQPTASNNYTWYRKYADGWVEQGGKFSNMNTTSLTVNLPIIMANTNYSLIGTGNIYNNTSGHFAPNSKTTTSFTCGVGDDAGAGGFWRVDGIAAQ